MLALLHVGGLRRAELAGLKLSDYDPETKILRLRVLSSWRAKGAREAEASEEGYIVRAEQTVSEMVVEALARQAEEQAARTGQPFGEAYEDVLETEAGRQLGELAEGPHRHERASYWEANLQFERVSERARHLMMA